MALSRGDALRPDEGIELVNLFSPIIEQYPCKLQQIKNSRLSAWSLGRTSSALLVQSSTALSLRWASVEHCFQRSSSSFAKMLSAYPLPQMMRGGVLVLNVFPPGGVFCVGGTFGYTKCRRT
jgi:hypothetical protein